MELPSCEICGVRAIYYQRFLQNDLRVGPVPPQAEGVRVPLNGEFVDVVVHACGGRVTRTGKKLFDQPAGGNGYIEWKPYGSLKEETQCPEASRILREMRTSTTEEK